MAVRQAAGITRGWLLSVCLAGWLLTFVRSFYIPLGTQLESDVTSSTSFGLLLYAFICLLGELTIKTNDF